MKVWLAMLSRLNDAMNLLVLRFREWSEDLSPSRRFMVVLAALFALFLLLNMVPYRGTFSSSHPRAYDHIPHH
jgi:hypothetical protein